MKAINLLLVTLSVLPGLARAQQNINVLTDSVLVTGPYFDSEAKNFTNRRTEYTPEIARYGLQFRNGERNVLTQPIVATAQNASAIIGASGPGTVVELNGSFISDNGGAKPSLYVGNGGRIKFGPQAQVDLVLQGSYFTRQFWIMGDGTGTVELDSAFVADRTQRGTVASGLGSIRLSACTLETKSSQSLPLGYRPWPNDANAQPGRGKINSHLVFENAPGSVWHVTQSPDLQRYKGGLWVRKSMEIKCDSGGNLELEGDTSVWSDYINYGGIYLQDTSLTVTKTGKGLLVLDGRHGYATGSTLSVLEGSVVFNTDPGQVRDSIFNPVRSGLRHGPNLHVSNPLGRSNVSFYTSTQSGGSFHLASLSSQASLLVKHNDTIITKGGLEVKGRLVVDFFQSPSIGDTLTIFRGNPLAIRPTEVVVGGLLLRQYADTTRLASDGQIIIRDRTAVAVRLPTLSIYPNPAKTHITLPELAANATVKLIDMQGKAWPLQRRLGATYVLPTHARGLYLVQADGYSSARLLVK